MIRLIARLHTDANPLLADAGNYAAYADAATGFCYLYGFPLDAVVMLKDSMVRQFLDQRYSILDQPAQPRLCQLRARSKHSVLFEAAVVALPTDHPLARQAEISITDLAEASLIVPDRRSRPHSHDLTIKLFMDAGLAARIAQVTEEKHTIVNLVATGTGLAIVPRWTARISVPGVSFVPLAVAPGRTLSKLILAAAWTRGTRDPQRDALLGTLDRHLKEIEENA